MKFISSLGIDTNLLVAQLLNFGLLLWLLNKFIYKPVVSRIEKDEAELEQAQIQNKILSAEKEKFKEKKDKEILEAKKQVKEIIEEAENIAKEIKIQASKETLEEKDAVIKQIKSRLLVIKDDKK